LLGEIVPEGRWGVGWRDVREVAADDKTRDLKEKLFSSTTSLCYNPPV
jgi:hypothetical protein